MLVIRDCSSLWCIYLLRTVNMVNVKDLPKYNMSVNTTIISFIYCWLCKQSCCHNHIYAELRAEVTLLTFWKGIPNWGGVSFGFLQFISQKAPSYELQLNAACSERASRPFCTMRGALENQWAEWAAIISLIMPWMNMLCMHRSGCGIWMWINISTSSTHCPSNTVCSWCPCKQKEAPETKKLPFYTIMQATRRLSGPDTDRKQSQNERNTV